MVGCRRKVLLEANGAEVMSKIQHYTVQPDPESEKWTESMEEWHKKATTHLGVRVFLCTRYVQSRKWDQKTNLTFNIEAVDGAEAASVAAELAYAVAWHRGVYPDPNSRAKAIPPEGWATAMTNKQGQLL